MTERRSDRTTGAADTTMSEPAPTAEAETAASAPAEATATAADSEPTTASDAVSEAAAPDAAVPGEPATEPDDEAAKPATERAAAGAKPAAERAPAGDRTGTPDRAARRGQPGGQRAERPERATDEHADRATGERAPQRLRERYRRDVVPALIKQFSYRNPMEVPRLSKIVVNIGLGEALTNAKAIDAATGDLAMITGQKPIVTRATRSIAQFRLRTGNPIGAKVTLRGDRMWDFLDRLTALALPRIRDFRGIPGRSFDGRGNYSLGFREQLAFPEIDYDKVDRLRGLEVSIVTTAKSDEESRRLLELLGMPFAG